MSLTVVRSEADDAVRLAPYLREADRQECLAASGMEPLAALRAGYEASADPKTVVDETGQPVAMFGVVPISPGVGSPWLLGSGRIEERWFEFTRRSRDEFHDLRQGWVRLTNYIDERNTLHIRWIRWLGFELVDRDAQHGAGRLPFWRFELHAA